MVPLESLDTVSYSHYIANMALSCIISEIKRDSGQQSRFFHTLLHSTPPLGGSPSKYCHNVWCGKTEVVWLPGGEKSLRIRLVVTTEYRRVTDRRMDI